MDFVRTKSGLYVPQTRDIPQHEQREDPGKLEKPSGKSWVRRTQDVFIVLAQLATVWILYLNYTHTVVPIQQKDLLAEQVAALQRDAERVTATVDEKMIQLRNVQKELEKSHILLGQLQSDRSSLMAQNDLARRQVIDANSKVAIADKHLKQVSGALELTEWNIFHVNVGMQQIKPHIAFVSDNKNFFIVQGALGTSDPGKFLIDRYEKNWPDLPAISESVAASIRKMKSNLFPDWMSAQFANVYSREARSLRCEKPNFDEMLSSYEKLRSTFQKQAADTVKAKEAKILANAQQSIGPEESKRIHYVISADDHHDLLVAESTELEVDAASNLNQQLYDRENACYEALSNAGDDFLEAKDRDPQQIPADLLKN
jgi:hypothetical protein